MSWSSFAIGAVAINPGLVLAPMSGVTSRPFRRLLKAVNPGAIGLTITEFISIEGLTRENGRSIEMMRSGEEESPFCIQLFGYDIARMRDAALLAVDSGADIIDINCGCPAPKVVKRGGGCELMRQPEHLMRMLREVRRAISVPLTIKIRSGWDDLSKNAVAIARGAEAEGIDAIAVHGRTRAQLYRGEPDWNIVGEVVQAVSIPVSGSGDITSRASADRALQVGVRGLFIGRAAMTNPRVFTEIVEGTPSPLPTPSETTLRSVALVRHYLDLLVEDMPERGCVGRMKQLVSQLAKGEPWSKEFCRVRTVQEQSEILDAVASGNFSSRSMREPEASVSDLSFYSDHL